jgi:hypothetical protein
LPPCTQALRALCAAAGWSEPGRRRLVMDAASPVDNKSLARACEYTLSMGSTVSVECMAWGTPSAFFQMGWWGPSPRYSESGD